MHLMSGLEHHYASVHRTNVGLHPQLVPLRSRSKFNCLFAVHIAIFIGDRKLNVFVIVTPSSVASST